MSEIALFAAVRRGDTHRQQPGRYGAAFRASIASSADMLLICSAADYVASADVNALGRSRRLA